MESILHRETLSSARTEGLFIFLMLVMGGLFFWRFHSTGWGGWSIMFLVFMFFFLFYSLNYRILRIRITTERLMLGFGLFTWRILRSNIESVYQDPTSLWRIGGAGIHFTPLNGRYRAFFNFLEFPRLVVVLREKKGPVKEVAFSTKQLDRLMPLLSVSEE